MKVITRIRPIREHGDDDYRELTLASHALASDLIFWHQEAVIAARINEALMTRLGMSNEERHALMVEMRTTT